MIFLVIGLLLFLGLHSLRIVAGDWRGQTIARIGAGPWKGIYSILSIVGFVLLVWGYSLAQPQSLLLWIPPVGLRHFASLLTLPAFVLLVAAYVPHNGIKAKVHHPMVLAVKVWALAHLLANGSVADVVLFGSFLVWAIFDFRAARLRDRQRAACARQPIHPPAHQLRLSPDALARTADPSTRSSPLVHVEAIMADGFQEYLRVRSRVM